MNKLPIGETIRSAYEFTLGHLGTIIGLIWVPMVAIAVLQFLPYGLGDNTVMPDQNAAAAGAAALRSIAFTLLILLLYACVNVAVMRQALGLRKGPAMVYFTLGWTELRLAGAMLALGLIVTVLMIVLVVAVIAVSTAGAALANKALTAALAGAVVLAGLCVILVSVVRLAFLIVPVTVVENKISFERGWLLTRGNFWRISAVMFAVTLPIVLITFIALLILMGGELSALFAAAQTMTPEDFLKRYRTIIDSHIPVILGINLIAAPFSLGLTLGAAAFGYKTLSATPAQTA